MSFLIVPVELFHSLLSHTDTIDNPENTNGVSIENSHKHCLLLKTEFREFLLAVQLNQLKIDLKPGFLAICYVNPLLSIGYSCNEQRGPPA